MGKVYIDINLTGEIARTFRTHIREELDCNIDYETKSNVSEIREVDGELIILDEVIWAEIIVLGRLDKK